MHNGNKPNPDELPTSAQLIKSTILAAVAAVVILVTIVLPSEYGIDPTGIGKAVGLAEMGEIKTQLAAEAEAEEAAQAQASADEVLAQGEVDSTVTAEMEAALVADAAVKEEEE